jgi:hypothetical protein
LTVINSTISGNVTRSSDDPGGISGGGGISSFFGGTLTLRNSTISNNTARDFFQGVGVGGGILSPLSGRGTTELTHTIVVGNSADDDTFADCGESLTSLGHNLVGAGTGCPSDGPGDLTVAPAEVFTTVLGPLQDNGGPTQTHALLPGSPGIDAGKTTCTDASGNPLTTDQRGRPRPVDGNGDGIAACDIGAFEFQAVPVSIDIKPGSLPNPINPNIRGVITVAILTTNTFDATRVDPASVKFGPKGATEAHGAGHTEDVDGDGDLDLVLHFRTQETGIKCGDTSASLIGRTLDGQQIEGTDSIKTVGCK